MKRAFDCTGPERDRRNQKRVTAWSGAWAIAFVGVSHAVEKEWLAHTATASFAVLLPAILGILTALAYRTFLREADELRRKIELEALALAYGVGVVGGLTYWLLERAGIVEIELPYLLVVMIVAHPIGLFIGHRRYA